MKLILRTVLFTLFLFTLHGTSYAGSDLYDQPDDRTFFQDYINYFKHESSMFNIKTFSSEDGKSRLDMDLLHKYLGYGTLLLAGVAATTGSDSSIHHSSAVGAATLGVMTCATGYYEYGDMFEIDEGFSQYNLHIALGTLGAIGFAAEAIIASTDSSHGGLGIGSTAAMGAALIIIKW